ncbi:hypothetical protein HPB47_026564 [Ixodes persulcatus]|uniref:Uncharacterized protein n=1 Tax=Ixodes persulcatus TaxID=34615 RepID=A0AC60PYD2_IXOPE|nr:hypothetical protein HPB47_026564 [Ixodes persulcatus]
MSESEKTPAELLAEIRSKDEEIRRLKSQLAQNKGTGQAGGLTKEDVARYSRQMILPGFGVAGQKALKSASVLIVGAGGLGCPCAAYLAAAGVGRIGLLDYDVVESSNLHRQILHSEAKLGMAKVDSLAVALRQLNSQPEYVRHNSVLDSSNALQILRGYQVVVDASDNVATRYLVSDACVRLGIPLVSGSALRWEGQLCVYNFNGGPCYRCLFPQPPPRTTVDNCSDGGVLGMVPGIIGSLQALEVVKILTGCGDVCSGRLLLLDGSAGVVRRVALRGRSANCEACRKPSSAPLQTDYAAWCGSGPTDKACSISVLPQEQRISCEELKERLSDESPPVVVDVRPEVQFEMCHIPGSTNVPLECLEEGASAVVEKLRKSGSKEVLVVCRRGNDSQLAVQKLQKLLGDLNDVTCTVRDIRGGLESWAQTVDPSFPTY